MKSNRWKFLVFGLSASISIVAQAAVTVGSAQFHAKLYSEALGRIPDQTGWNSAMNYYANSACNSQTLLAQGVSVLTSSEFSNLTPNNNEKIFKLIRAAFHRDPNSSEFSTISAQLNSGTSWNSIVQSIFTSTEFNQRVSIYCGSAPSGWQPTQPFNVQSTSTGSFSDTSGSNLQSLIDQTPPGGTVYLEQGAIVKLNQSLILRQGRTLSTIGLPGRRHSGLLGRLVRDSGFNAPLVQLEAGSTLKSVWIDGQKNRFGYSRDAINLNSVGSNIQIIDNLITDSAGWTNSQYYGSYDDATCSYGYIGANLITAYGATHTIPDSHTDGLSVACENTTVENNEIIDATDVSIIVFPATPRQGAAVTQRSIVRNNFALNAGNSAYAAYAVDGLRNRGVSHNFLGTVFQNNTIWSSPVAHIDIVLAVGTRPWFGSTSDIGYGPSFDGNTTGISTVRGNMGIAISGMKEVYVQNNVLSFLQVPASPSCPLFNVGASTLDGYASGNIQSFINTVIPACNWHQ
ncbi:hypothetical protein [Undibacterium sp. Ji49W]|uniref:hypothetical protein n=1 Tax=Undibacterium sp. Ji49W TaxID=3413040 RepID=UPI003BF37205